MQNAHLDKLNLAISRLQLRDALAQRCSLRSIVIPSDDVVKGLPPGLTAPGYFGILMTLRRFDNQLAGA
jgi:hypothetical protein